MRSAAAADRSGFVSSVVATVLGADIPAASLRITWSDNCSVLC